MSKKMSWLPEWAQKIAGLSSADPTWIEPWDLREAAQKMAGAAGGAPGGPRHPLCRCACGGATLWAEPTSKGEEVRVCVQCGAVMKDEGHVH